MYNQTEPDPPLGNAGVKVIQQNRFSMSVKQTEESLVIFLLL